MWLQPGVSKLSPELSELVVYTCSVPFKGFAQAAERPASEMSSFSESKALRLIKDSGRMWGWIHFLAALWSTIRCGIKQVNLSTNLQGRKPLVFWVLSHCVFVLLVQGFILSVTTVTSWAGSTLQDSASSPQTTTLRICGMEAVRLVRD